MIVAVTGSRAAALCRLVKPAVWNPLEFRISAGSLEEFDPKIVGPEAVLASADDGTDDALLEASIRLRTHDFFWGPVYLLVSRSEARPDLIDDWEIHLRELPPRDVRGLVAEIAASAPLPADRRRSIMLNALRSIAEQLVRIAQRIAPSSAPTPEQIRAGIQRVQDCLASVQEPMTFEGFAQELAHASTMATISEPMRISLQAKVAAVEEAVRSQILPGRQQERPGKKNSQPDSGLKNLVQSLHGLSNELLHPQREEAGAPRKIADRLDSRVERLQLAAGQEFPTMSTLCAGIHQALQAIREHALEPEHEYEIVVAEAAAMHHWLAQHEPNLLNIVEHAKIERIVVVEDHPQWQKTLHSTLLGLGLPLPVAIAGDLEKASTLLDEGSPALVFVDLGLPMRVGLAPEPEAGLILIRRFTGTDRGVHHRHRFVILTAATNYSEAVRGAMELGVAPASYLHKSPAVCNAEIAAQVWLALQPPKERLPRIELDVLTECIARVDNHEIRLDRPIWCLLAAFAGGYWTECAKVVMPRWKNRTTLATALAHSSLDPSQVEVAEGCNEDDEIDGTNHEALTSEQPNIDQDETVEDAEMRLHKRVPDYISTLRKELDRAYRQAHHQAPPLDFIDSEYGRYRLNAELLLLGEVSAARSVCGPPIVLVVEDDEHWRSSIADGLEQRGLKVLIAATIADAKQAVQRDVVDLISLDLELPADQDELARKICSSHNALNFLAFLRSEVPDIPVAVLTGIAFRDSVMPQILKEGVRVEDYIYKGAPDAIMRLAISLSRLWLELNRNVRILDWDPHAPAHAIHLDPVTGILSAIGPAAKSKPFIISGVGLKILKALSERPNAMVTREHLLDVVYPDTEKWGKDPDNALDLHISRLRKAISDQTGVPGSDVICGGPGGVYWLQGVLQ